MKYSPQILGYRVRHPTNLDSIKSTVLQRSRWPWALSYSNITGGIHPFRLKDVIKFIRICGELSRCILAVVCFYQYRVFVTNTMYDSNALLDKILFRIASQLTIFNGKYKKVAQTITFFYSYDYRLAISFLYFFFSLTKYSLWRVRSSNVATSPHCNDNFSETKIAKSQQHEL